MLSLCEKSAGQKVGVTRRQLLAIGSLGFVGLSLPQLLRAEAAAGVRGSQKAIINVHLDGGPSQLDTIDLKADAPAEIRGPFAPISTALAGVQICELLPQLASIADRLTFVRSLVGSAGRHDAFQCQSGFDIKDLASFGGRPTLGCVVSKLQGSPTDPAPSFVDLMQGRPLVRNSARPGFLGPSYQPFRPDISQMFHRELEEGMKGELARLGGQHNVGLALNPELSVERLTDRRQVLAQLDRFRRSIDSSGMMDAVDRFTAQAVSILTSGRMAKALDLEAEEPRVLDRYALPAGAVAPAEERFVTAEGPESVLKFLLARRLVEAGVRCVSISISDFDTHSDNFGRLRNLLPIVDHGLATLIADLQERGLLEDVAIVVWGEFGRTPKINAKSGRDHWPAVGPCLMAGGGWKTGQVIGATDRQATRAVERPVFYKDVFATLYHHLGINARRTTLIDPQGRPQYLLDAGEALRELV